MLQKPELTFVNIRWRKRRDRFLQLAILAAGLGVVGKAVSTAIAVALRAATRATLPPSARPLAMALPFLAATAMAITMRRRVGSDVADVMAATASAKDNEDEPAMRDTFGGPLKA